MNEDEKESTKNWLTQTLIMIAFFGALMISEVKHGHELAALRAGQADVGAGIAAVGQGLEDLGQRIDRLAEALGMAPVENGLASYYSHPFHGRQAADGSIFDKDKLTAAHRTWPFGSRWLIRNLKTGKSVVITLTDRGPYIMGRTWDLSEAAFRKIAPLSQGLCQIMAIRLSPRPSTQD